ncbi:anaerobic ribonucleoside triphosphate reductase [Gorillibacterium massiliense]|uniref:anaerobic ribonucleoside triphosphate reductase n=1 Tax=Gorillibacterium massiliense TaxID=1280390 RepID=UPI0004B53317|nr:anaerobic ribonucleoside triphosphate reductase [Gorillibacterium massiliense]
MITKIRKRDGRETPFSIEKIANAIRKAAISTGETSEDGAFALAEKVLLKVNAGDSQQVPQVEQIQDIVEEVLMMEGLVHTAKAYILYRAERTRVREMDTRLMRIYEDITNREAADSEIKRENANVDGDTSMGMMLKYGSEGAKQFNEMFILKPEHSAAHRVGDIHIHDLDFLTLTTTCCQIDIEQLFEGGFGTGHGSLREPNDIQSYAALACIAIQSNQNDQHGGQSIPNFDYGLAKGVAKTYARHYRTNMNRLLEWRWSVTPENNKAYLNLQALYSANPVWPNISSTPEERVEEERLLSELTGSSEQAVEAQRIAATQALADTERSTYQAMEALIHNLNTMHSRAGAQTPFSSINYGTDTTPEGRMVVRGILLATEKGLGNGETPIFPIQIFRVKEGTNYNPGDPNYDLFQLACQVSAKRLFPNFSFQDAPFNLQYYKPGKPETEIAYMGCRTRVIGNVHDPEREITFGRGNLSFTTINLVRLALKHRGDVNAFFLALNETMDLTVDQIFERYEIQARKKVKNFPFLMGQGVWLDSGKLGPEDEIREVIKHGSLSVGFIGLAECLKALIGSHHGETAEAKELGLRIIGTMRKRMDAESERTGMNFTLLATPAEGLSGRFVKMDQLLFGSIPGVTDRDYYTNSFHVPVYHDITAYDKIQTEAPYHALTNAGHITYVELDGDPLQNLQAFEKIVRAMKESGVGYGSVNHPVDRDPVCGYTGIIDDECPFCGRQETEGAPRFERIRRITGYLVGTLDRFNNAKKAEEHDRVKHG